MRVLVTGHNGYIGTVLTPMLRAAGHDVVGMDSDLYEACTFEQGGVVPEVPWIRKDVRTCEAADFVGFDAVLHLAALSNDPLGNFRPETTFSINYEGTMRVARLAKSVGVSRFIFSSTCSNYGASGPDFIDETSAFNPVTPYGESKVKSEQELAALNDERFAVTSLRSATAYGVGPRLRFDLVLNNLVAWAITTGKIHMKSDGTPWRPIVHIEDIAQAFLCALEAPVHVVRGEAFNVGVTEHNYQIRELAQMVADVVPDCEISFADDAGPDLRSYRVNCDKIRKALPNFKPRWSPQTGAQSIYEACRHAGLSLEDFEGPKYQRIGHIHQLIEKGIIDRTLAHTPDARSKWASETSGASDIEMDSKDVSCISCGHTGLIPILDLGLMPRSDGLIVPENEVLENYVPLRLAFCPNCGLVQLLETRPPEEMFGDDYVYFSSVSEDLLAHSREHALSLIKELGLGDDNLVVEIASNDGYMLKNFREHGINVLGVDPAPEPVRLARERGIDTLNDFFGKKVADQLVAEGRKADVIIANNVVAHVEDQNDLVSGFATLVSDQGKVVVEFPYVRDLIEKGEFDTVYHEHRCYFSVRSAQVLFERHGLYLVDVKRLPIHGGSVRLSFRKTNTPSDAVARILDEEAMLGLNSAAYYAEFGERVRAFRRNARKIIADLKADGARVAAYGAAAKGTILLNYLGLNSGAIEYAADQNPKKQGRQIPGVRIPIVSPDRIKSDPPDVLMILPWNFRDEIIRQQQDFLANGGKFLVPIPDLELVEK